MAIQKEIWARTIVEGLFADNSFASKSVNDNMYVNEGKKVHIPNAGKPSNVVKNRKEVPAKASKRTDNDLEYTLDEFTTDPVHIPHAETVELSYDKRNSVIMQDRTQLIETAHDSLLRAWAAEKAQCISTTGESTAAHASGATGNRKKVSKADIRALMTKFDNDNLPQTGRYLLLDAEMYGQLLESLTETDQIGFFKAADVKKGIIGELYGFNVMKRSKVLTYKVDGSVLGEEEKGSATDNAAALAWHETATSRGLGEVVIFSDENSPTYYGDIYSFLVRCGGAKRRTDKKGVYALVQASVA